MKDKVVVIAGPTASGKTGLSIELAKYLNGEIVSCDSMQIYKDMTIGTAKPTKEEMQGIKHYLIDCALPEERYSVARYKKEAESAIKEILENEKFPIVVGGTGLYVNSLIYNINYQDVITNIEYRNYLQKQIDEHGLLALYEEACKIDPVSMEKISQNDRKRIMRVLEIFHETGNTKTKQEEESRKIKPVYDYYTFALDMPRDILYDRINKRVDIMIENGLIEEVENIIKKYNSFPTAMQGLGYKEVIEYLEQRISKEEMIEKIKMETRRYAKRQLTWFRKNKEIIWLDGLKSKEHNIYIIMKELEKSGTNKQGEISSK